MKLPSFELVNYALRPAKAAERKMLCDLFRRLEHFAPVETYRYVGFGSIYFTDFQLFHQALGICDMCSLEKETEKEMRFDFNKPYRCIDLRMGESGSILPTLEWVKPSIVWLDYDGRLNRSVLADVATVCSRAKSGSILLISVNVQPEVTAASTMKQQEVERLAAFVDAVGEDNVPLGLSGAELRGPKLAELCRRIISSKIKQELAYRNGPLNGEQRINYTQLVNFGYADGARMLTVGGIFYEGRHTALVSKCNFEMFPFVAQGERAHEIRAPRLTPKELRHLNAQLPHLPAGQLRAPGVPEADIQDYAAIYRYYPNFGEVVLT
jgi:hypothetical protein